MNVTLGLLGHTGDGGGGGGDGVPSDGSTTDRSILTGSKGDNTTVMSNSEVNSSYPDENLDGLELGLGLSIGGCGGLKSKGVVVANGGWGQYARILTAKDFQISKPKPKPKPNSTCSSSSVNIPNSSTSGTKRTATDSVSPPNGTSVVGWPPVSKARIPSLANQIKSPTVNLMTTTEQNKSTNRTIGMNKFSNERNVISNTKYRSIKVNMDGSLIGRKVDLNAHTSYETLALTLEEMFLGRRSITDAARPSRLLDSTSEFVLTYEDKDGDCMLVGDVPWQMFLSSVKRLRIMINSESNELSSEFSAKQQE